MDKHIRWLTPLAVTAFLFFVLSVHLLPSVLSALFSAWITLKTKDALEYYMSMESPARIMTAGLLAVAICFASIIYAANVAVAHTNLEELSVGISTGLFTLKKELPAGISTLLPENTQAIGDALLLYAKEHFQELKNTGVGVIHGLIYTIFGAIIGISIVANKEKYRHPAAKWFSLRAGNLYHAFGKVFAAQIKISLVNTMLTGLFLLVILPLFDTHIPFAKTLVVITFFAGLMPVLGNLISNTIIALVAILVSTWVALASLTFLVVIHKLEYVLNAKIVGGEINSKVWEMLLAMLICESVFGIQGLIVAPIFYAWVKEETRISFVQLEKGSA